MKKYLPFFVISLALGAALSVGSVVSAATCGTDADGKPIETSLLQCTGSSTTSVSAMVLVIINFIAVGVGIAVVAGLALGGFVYAQSGGDASKVKQAKDIILNAIIGLVLFFIMWAGANFLVPGGLFKP